MVSRAAAAASITVGNDNAVDVVWAQALCSHSGLRCDSVLPELLGMNKIISEDAVSDRLITRPSPRFSRPVSAALVVCGSQPVAEGSSSMLAPLRARAVRALRQFPALPRRIDAHRRRSSSIF